jgi:dephospho-CoA kinase
MPRIIGLTGGIATGKSTVSRTWNAAGAKIIDADEVARAVVRPGGLVLRLIRWQFGREVTNSDGTLNRAALGQLIFADASKRRRLNLIMHPFITASMLRRLMVALVIRFEPVVVLDTPLLYESVTLLPLCNATVVVACTAEQQLQRLLQRSRDDARGGRGSALTEGQAKDRIAAQMPLSDKVARAQYVLNNTESQQELQKSARKLLSSLRPAPAGELAFRALVIGSTAKLLAAFLWGSVPKS